MAKTPRRTTVETTRLILRPFTPDDVAAYAEVRAKPEVVRFFPKTGETPAEVAARVIDVFATCWCEHGYGPWTVIERATGILRGHHGLRYLPEFGETEILYMLDDAVWNRGYASEAAAAARDYAFDDLGLDRVMAIALPENLASIRVMEKTGLVYERMANFKGYRHRYYALDRHAR